MRVPFHVAVALLFCVCSQSGLHGQPSGPDAPAGKAPPLESPRPTAASEAEVEQVKPDTFILPDEQGTMRPMLGWTFEDFLRVWRMGEQGRDLPEEPAYSIQHLECSGQWEGGDFALLTVQMEIRLRDDRRTRIPLAFPNGILDGYELSPQNDAAYVHFDEDLGEHVLWTAGQAGEAMRVELRVHLPLAHRGAKTVLKFHAPRAATSQCRLVVPGSEVFAESLTNDTQVSATTEGDKTRIIARGLAETTEIAWRSLERSGMDDVRSLVTQSDIRVVVEQGRLTSEVNLSVQNLRGELDRFRIRVPAPYALVSEELETATLHHIDDGLDAAPPPANVDVDAQPSSGAIYEIRLAKPQLLPFVARLVVERPLSLAEDETEVTLEGVEVLDAAGQQGKVSVVVSEDLRVRWEVGRQVRQVATTRESVGDADVTATFEFHSGDWQLPLVLAARRTEVSVAPDYELEVGRDELRLTATFHYSLRGKLQGNLRYALSGWQLADEDPKGPESTIRGTSAFVDKAGTMFLPLANPAEGSFETTLRLRMPRSSSSNLLQIRLPECLIDGAVQEGRLSVRADPSIEVTPQIESSHGLASGRPPSPASAPPSPLEDLVHEFRVTSLPAEYVALVRPRTRTIVHETRVRADVYADHVFVDQEIHLDVRRLPANDLVLRAQAALVDNTSATFSLDGQSIAPPWEDVAQGSGLVEGRVVLEQPLVGPTVLRIQYQLPVLPDDHSAQATRSPLDLVLPLAMPVADSHRLVAALSNRTSDLQAEFRRPTIGSVDTTNEGAAPPGADDPAHLELAAPVYALPISLRQADAASGHALVVDRVWIQTRVAGGLTQTRTAMQLAPTTDQIVLDVDAEASGEDVSVWANGKPIPAGAEGSGKVVISTSDWKQDAPCVIVVLQQSPFAPEIEGRLRIVPPRVVDASAYTNVYWQLVLPQSLHGFSTSEEFVSESPWEFQGAYWARVPTMTQAELEDLFGLEHGPLLPASANQLLVSGFDLPHVLEARLVRRSSMVLLASGGILTIGVASLYIRKLQRWELAAVTAAALAVAGMIWPTFSPFVAQAGFLGALLVLVAVLLKRLSQSWQTDPSESSATDTSIFPREAVAKESTSVGVSSPETTSSARVLVQRIAESGVQHSA